MGCDETREPVVVLATTSQPVVTAAPSISEDNPPRQDVEPSLPDETVSTLEPEPPRAVRPVPIIVDDPVVTPVRDGLVFRATDAEYRPRALLGRGSAGEVYLVTRSTDGQEFALKRCPRSAISDRELDAYRAVRNQVGFPQLVDAGEEDGWAYIVMTRIGRRIEDIRTVGGGRLTMLPTRTVASIGIQMVDRLETLHGLGYVHLDMYPNNVAVGLGPESTTLYLFDFGEARQVVATTDRSFRPLQSFREDIRSLSHSVLQLLRPGTRYGDYKHYEDDRNRPSLAELCAGLPEPVLRLFEYSHTQLGFEVPDYTMLRALLLEMAPEYAGRLLW